MLESVAGGLFDRGIRPGIAGFDRVRRTDDHFPLTAQITDEIIDRILVDLGDAVADRLGLPFDRISLEMLYRGFYHFSRAYSNGLAEDPVSYFADPANRDLAVVKPLRKPISRLDLSPFPI